MEDKNSIRPAFWRIITPPLRAALMGCHRQHGMHLLLISTCLLLCHSPLHYPKSPLHKMSQITPILHLLPSIYLLYVISSLHSRYYSSFLLFVLSTPVLSPLPSPQLLSPLLSPLLLSSFLLPDAYLGIISTRKAIASLRYNPTITRVLQNMETGIKKREKRRRRKTKRRKRREEERR